MCEYVDVFVHIYTRGFMCSCVCRNDCAPCVQVIDGEIVLNEDALFQHTSAEDHSAFDRVRLLVLKHSLTCISSVVGVVWFGKL